MKLQIGFFGFCILILLSGSCTNNPLRLAERQKLVDYSDLAAGTNAITSQFNQLLVTSSLDQIALLLSLTEIHDPKDLDLAVKGHLIAALDVNETNQLIFPSIITFVRTNQYYIAATAWRHARIPTNKYTAKVSLASPLWHSESKLLKLAKSVPASYIHDFETVFVLDSDMANIESYLHLMQRIGKDSYLGDREVAYLLICELNNADSYIEILPGCAQMIRSNKSYILAKEWRKHVRVTY